MLDIITNLLSNPAVQESAIKGLATALGSNLGKEVLETINKRGTNLIDSTGKLTQNALQFFSPIAKKYIENYTQRHGNLNILGMGKPITLEEIYIQVNINPEIVNFYQTIDDVEKIYRQREFKGKEKRLGMEIANQEQYLMVLGHPGAGKSTFLKKIGLEALKGRKNGEYEHNCIPVLLELRRFNDRTEVDLVTEIAKEFNHCDLPEYQTATEELLKNGKLLIILDGLDEVPQEQLSHINSQIRNLRDKYSQNRFIVSCRIAAYRNFDSFRNFTQAVVADFDDKQTQEFIDKWFKSHNQPEWGEKCWQKLSDSNNKATKELTKTPLLLALICILFKNRGEFPDKKATLYEKTLSTLLSEWDALKEISRDKIYEGLDNKGKEILLGEFAYNTFIEDNLFFQKTEISREIERILGEMLPDKKFIDGKKVLRAIEEQNGILIQRGDDFYSFSHLTLHEFLTAYHLIYENLDLEPFVKEHLCDSRYREVFLILAGLQKADQLLLLMEKKTHSLINTPKLQDLLEWVEKVADTTSGDIQVQGKRGFALANALANKNSYKNSYNYENLKVYMNLSLNVKTYAKGYSTSNAHDYDYPNPKAYGYAKSNPNAQNNAYAIDEFIRYIEWCQKFQVYRGVDFYPVINKLRQLKGKIPDDSQSLEVKQDFTQKLIKYWLSVFHLTPEIINLSKEEIKMLDDYFYGNLLMVHCKQEAQKVTPKVWEGIESRMILPQS